MHDTCYFGKDTPLAMLIGKGTPPGTPYQVHLILANVHIILEKMFLILAKVAMTNVYLCQEKMQYFCQDKVYPG